VKLNLVAVLFQIYFRRHSARSGYARLSNYSDSLMWLGLFSGTSFRHFSPIWVNGTVPVLERTQADHRCLTSSL